MSRDSLIPKKKQEYFVFPLMTKYNMEFEIHSKTLQEMLSQGWKIINSTTAESVVVYILSRDKQKTDEK